MTNKIIALIVMALVSGCSMMQSDKQTLNINCTVPGTVLKVNGDRFDCPAKVDVRRDSKVIIGASKEGHEPYLKTVDYHLSTAAKWDMVGTVFWFFPVFGLMSPGAWEIDQTDFNIQLFAQSTK